MLSCDVSGCDEPRMTLLGAVWFCGIHATPIVNLTYVRPEFRCSAETEAGLACRRQGHPVDGLPDFIELCPQHETRFFHYQRRKREEEGEKRVEREQAEKAEKRRRSVVYFVERESFIKIGTSADLRTRLLALARGGQMPEGMTVGPVVLLATVPGDRGNEGYLHRQFAEHRIPATEWFYPAAELIAFIAGLKSRTPEFDRFRQQTLAFAA